MSISAMTHSGESHIPNGWTGQIDSEMSLESGRPLENRKITEALQVIEHDIEQLLQLRSSLTQYGLSKICPNDFVTATENNGMVLGAKEKNSTIPGTLARKIENSETKVKILSFSLTTQALGNSFFGSADISKISGYPQGTFLSIPLLASLRGYFHYTPSFGVTGTEFRVFTDEGPSTFDCTVACLYKQEVNL